MPDASGAPPAPGRLIFLSGASSSGKTTLARAVQGALPTPFLHVESDLVARMLPGRREAEGPFAYLSVVRPRFYAGFHRCLPALAGAGNDLVVDHLIEYAAWRAELRSLLAGYDVFLVGVHCGLDELERRERARGDRRLGEGREHLEVDRVHALGGYDLEVDTAGRDPEEQAAEVIEAWSARRGSSRLFLA